MMDYQSFKDVVVEKILDFMPPEYANAIVEVHDVEKVNQTLDGLTIRKDKDQMITPSVYLNGYYEMYQNNGNLEETLTRLVDNYCRACHTPEFSVPTDFKEMKDKVVMTLINTEQNKEMLENLPHKEFQDLSVVFRVVVSKDENGIASAKVDYSIMKQMGVDPEQLFQLAAVNTKEMFPPKVKNMFDVMKEMFIQDGLPEEMLAMFEEQEPKEAMLVISNEMGVNGAVSMLYDETLHKLSEKLGTDLYILPSSIHETIAISVEMGDPESLAEMVHQANNDVVALGDRLSNNVYHYDKDLRKLTLATDVPNKRLDGIVSEAPMVYEAGKSR